jgi:ferredoxin
MTLLDDFIVSFDVWEQARPYLGMMVDKPEMQLIVLMKGKVVTVDQVADLLGMTRAQAAEFLARCYSRGMVNKQVENSVTTFSPADFYKRLDYFVKYENWDDIPPEARKMIDRRYLDEFIAKQRPKVEELMRSGQPGGTLPNGAVMLLSEIEEMIEAATDIVVSPCDCRRLGQNCTRPVETCIAFDQSALDMLDRGRGRRLTKAEAQDLVRRADKRGLMHTADSEWRTRGLHELCNCCACDCYPFRAAQELGSKGFWPKSRYIAVYDREPCNLCGACVKRCHFDAFYHTGTQVEVEGQARPDVQFDPTKCWGCGLCVNGCPSEAIVMERL